MANPRRSRPALAASGAEPTQKLHKVLAQAGFGSRRLMESWIASGRVKVNGTVATIGTRVSPHDTIRVGRRIVRRQAGARPPRVVLYHKPEGEIVSRADPEARASVFERLPQVHGGRWVAVGRLDYNTGGLLLFTTSGELANRMMHPRYGLEREYAVRTLGQLNAGQIARLTHGIALDGDPARFINVEDAGGEGANHWYRIVVAEGRNRLVRRMLAALGVTVSRLMRVRFGSVRLPPRLKRGRWTELDVADVNALLAELELRRTATPPDRSG